MSTNTHIARLARSGGVSLAVLLVCSSLPRAGAQCLPTVELIPSDRAAEDYFGNAVAISGNTAVVGAYAKIEQSPFTEGAVYVFTRNGSFWTQQAKLTIPGEAGGFGSSVAISGDTILVGAPAYQGISNPGSAYVFSRSGTTWSLQATLRPPESQASDDVGWSVALGLLSTHMVALVGAPFSSVGSSPNAGAAYVYTLDTLHVGSAWTEQSRLIASDAAHDNFLGWSLSISGTTAVLGAWGNANVNGPSAGAGYVYTSNSAGGGWTQQTKLIAAGTSNTGYTCAVNQDTTVLANSLHEAHIFTRSSGAWTLHQAIPIVGPYGIGGVRAIGDTMLFGVWADLPYSSQGRIAFWTRPPGSGIAGVWSRRTSLFAPDALIRDRTAYSVDFSGSLVIAGAPQHQHNPALSDAGAAYIFDTSALCIIDFDCNGSIGVPDIFAFLNAWFAQAPYADFNGDGALQVQDVFDFLSAWFAGTC